MTATTTTPGVREGFTTVTAYLVAAQTERLVQFTKDAFGAIETGRAIGGSGHPHIEVRIGDSMLMCGGGAPGPERPAALHMYGPDVDAVYQRAIAAGAESLSPPVDRPYGDREAGVKDPTGNIWYLATRLPGEPVMEGIRTVTPFLHQSNPLGLIEFLKQAFGARELGIHHSPEGRLMHAVLRIGTALLEMGEAPPMPGNFYLYVPDADRVYEHAIEAGAKSIYAPVDYPYGDRMGVVEDQWGNTWCIATHRAQLAP